MCAQNTCTSYIYDLDDEVHKILLMAFPDVLARRHIQPNMIDLNAMTEIHTVRENHIVLGLSPSG